MDGAATCRRSDVGLARLGQHRRSSNRTYLPLRPALLPVCQCSERSGSVRFHNRCRPRWTRPKPTNAATPATTPNTNSTRSTVPCGPEGRHGLSGTLGEQAFLGEAGDLWCFPTCSVSGLPTLVGTPHVRVAPLYE
jgi:hypothetical protein